MLTIQVRETDEGEAFYLEVEYRSSLRAQRSPQVDYLGWSLPKTCNYGIVPIRYNIDVVQNLCFLYDLNLLMGYKRSPDGAPA